MADNALQRVGIPHHLAGKAIGSCAAMLLMAVLNTEYLVIQRSVPDVKFPLVIWVINIGLMVMMLVAQYYSAAFRGTVDPYDTHFGRLLAVMSLGWSLLCVINAIILVNLTVRCGQWMMAGHEEDPKRGYCYIFGNYKIGDRMGFEPRDVKAATICMAFSMALSMTIPLYQAVSWRRHAPKILRVLAAREAAQNLAGNQMDNLNPQA